VNKLQAYVLSYLILLAAFILQTTVVPHLKIFGVQPDLILIVVVTYAFLYGPVAGSIAGFFGGILQDMVLIRGIGFNALGKAIMGYLGGMVEKAMFADNIILIMIAIFLATILNQLIYSGLFFLIGEKIHLWSTFLTLILPSAVYNAVLAPFIYHLLYRIVVFDKKAPVFK
jgi:rod shape-determining protein MreD